MVEERLQLLPLLRMTRLLISAKPVIIELILRLEKKGYSILILLQEKRFIEIPERQRNGIRLMKMVTNNGMILVN